MEENKELALNHARTIAKRLYDTGAKKVELLDISKKTDQFSYMILSSGTSFMATKLLATELSKFANTNQISINKTEGEFKGEWIIIDCREFVVHILTDQARAKYHLDKLWKSSKNALKFA